MKNHITIFLLMFILLLSFSQGQDIMTMKSGIEHKGEFLGIKEGKVYFLPEDKIKEYKYFNEKISRVNVVKHNGILLINDGKWMLSEEAKVLYTLVQGRRSFRLNPEYIKEICDRNSKKSILMMPVSKDYYGFSEYIKIKFDSACFNIKSNMNGLKYLDSKGMSSENINNFHLDEIGKDNGVDYVSHGYAFMIEVPNKASTPSVASGLAASSIWGSSDNLTSLLESLPSAFAHYGDVKNQRMLAKEAGTYLAVTFYLYDVKSGKKEFVYQNTIIKKLG